MVVMSLFRNTFVLNITTDQSVHTSLFVFAHQHGVTTKTHLYRYTALMIVQEAKGREGGGGWETVLQMSSQEKQNYSVNVVTDHVVERKRRLE